MRTRLKLLTVGVVFVTAAVAGCTTSTPEPVAPAGATQDDALKVVPPPPAGSYGGGIQDVGATDADGDSVN